MSLQGRQSKNPSCNLDNEIRSQSKPLNMQLRAAISAHSLCKGGLHCKAFVLWENKEKEKEEKKKEK